MAPKKSIRKTPTDSAKDFDRALKRAAKSPARYVLRLYVTGSTPRSAAAIANLRAFCETHLAGRYELEVIDVYQQPAFASDDQVIAAPTLIKRLPAPLRKIVGDLSNDQRILRGLDLQIVP